MRFGFYHAASTDEKTIWTLSICHKEGGILYLIQEGGDEKFFKRIMKSLI